jgi:lysophospholipase L1-like esterase
VELNPAHRTRPRRHRRAALPALLTGLAVAAALLVAPAQAAKPSPPAYVALGDSYSSGTGTRSYIADGTDCLRSVYAYPSLVAASQRYDLNFRACSGATVADVENRQVPALGSGTAYVTVSVGGNDAGFADVLTECAQPAWLSDCMGAIDDAEYIVQNVLPGRLETLYAQIGTRAPNARVVVVGYPRIFGGEDCNLGTWFSGTEMSRLNATADLLNARTKTLAATAGFSFADPTDVFVGHAVCADQEWINGLSWPVVESYHPNRDGHASGYTPTVSPVLTGTTVKGNKKVRGQALAQAGALAAEQRTYAGVDAAIEQETVTAPDLTTRRARLAAQRADVDLSSRASIDAADREYSRAQAREWRESR